MLIWELKENPFTREYFEEELKAFNPKRINSKRGKVNVKEVKFESGRLDGYMYKDFVIEPFNFPAFYIDNTLWMSITPMEVESHYMPIILASGDVGVAGLGIGYYVQRIIEKDSVESITIFEKEQEVVDLYLENFGSHPKVKFVIGDVKEAKGYEFDFFYNDIYEGQGDVDAWKDMATLLSNNHIESYHFWTIEMFILSALINNKYDELPFNFKHTYGPYLKVLLDTKEGLVEDRFWGIDSIEEIEKSGVLEYIV